jgi:hypothetical protein
VRVLLQSNPTEENDMFTIGHIPDQADGGHTAGDGQIDLIGDGLPYWPEAGFVFIVGTRYTYRRTGGSIFIAPALASSLSGGEIVELDVGGKGLGDSTEPGHPTLVPYTSPGTTGGQIADVR